MSDLNTADILRKARDHIAHPGMWWQGAYFSGAHNAADISPHDGPCCLLGAVSWAGGRDAARIGAPAVHILEQAISEHDESLTPDIWNDTPGRTQAEVVALFDRAIELAEQEGAS